MKKKIFLFLLKLFFLSIVLVGIFITTVYHGIFGHLPSQKELLEYRNETASIVLSEDGKTIGRFFAKNRTNITYEEIPKHLINALIATEDVRYFEHNGIDSKSLLRVFIKTFLFQNRSSGGGSTINQQLLKNMLGRPSFGPLTIFVNKTKEAILAPRRGHCRRFAGRAEP